MKRNGSLVDRLALIATTALAAAALGMGTAHAEDPITYTWEPNGSGGKLTVKVMDLGGTSQTAGGEKRQISVAGISTEVTVPLVTASLPGAHDLTFIYEQAGSLAEPTVTAGVKCENGRADGFQIKFGLGAASASTSRSLSVSGIAFYAGQAVPFSQLLLDSNTSTGTPDLGTHEVIKVC